MVAPAAWPGAGGLRVGPKGVGLARALAAAETDCIVAAPSTLIRPAGDRITTDARDAAHLTRLLLVG